LRYRAWGSCIAVLYTERNYSDIGVNAVRMRNNLDVGIREMWSINLLG